MASSEVPVKHIHHILLPEMVVVETLWQLHTLTVINSWLYCVSMLKCTDSGPMVNPEFRAEFWNSGFYHRPPIL